MAILLTMEVFLGGHLAAQGIAYCLRHPSMPGETQALLTNHYINDGGPAR